MNEKLKPLIALASEQTYIAQDIKTEEVQSEAEKLAEIKAKIHLYAEKYGISYDRMYDTIDCETAHTFDPNIQSSLRYDFSSAKRGIVKGEREQSYGLAQIHLPDHPQVTIAQAKDEDYALDFMAKHMANGNRWWYCEK